MISQTRIKEILSLVQKPGRYTGGEWNAVRKDPESVDLKVALAFPDLYEIGMSYLGQKILYFLLNKNKTILAERVFAPASDFEAVLRQKNIPLFSLENRIPLYQFDVIGFSLLYELNYSSVLTILDLGRIPFVASERGDHYPLVIGGGPAVFNPEPVAEIFDLFLIGEGEEAVFEILDRYSILKKEHTSRQTALDELAKIRGIYVPSLYQSYKPSRSSLLAVKPLRQAPSKIKKRIVYPFHQAPFPENIIVPNIDVVFDRVAVEVSRGCPQNCRFCQASSVYFPSRVKDPSSVLDTVFKSLHSTGYEDASLASLSVGDYPYLNRTVKELMEKLEQDKVSLSLPSLRPGGLTESVAENIIRVRKTGFTLVPEAGTERLRCVINKNLKDEILWDAASNAFSLGWRLLKLYFMVGLPTEKDEDLEGIVCVVEEMLRLGKNILKHPPQINLSVSSFIPKPHTPFQWLKMENKQTLKDKHAMIRSRLKKYRSVRFKTHSVDLSVLEGIFSRGDRRLNPVLIRAWQSGARLDSWIDCFDFQLWQKAFDTEKLDRTMYLDKLPRDAVLPWDHVETGIKKVYLRQELDRALAGQPTKSCLEKDCRMCQGCTLWPLYEKEFSAEVSPSPVTSRRLGKKTDDTIRYRAVYDKQQMARFLSHNDLSRIIQRGFRRAGLSVQFSGGFHPKMNFSFLPALPLGMAGKEEVLEFKSAYEFLEKDLLSRLNDSLPEGILFSHLEKIETSRPSLNDDIQTMVYSIKLDSEQLKRLANHLVKTETDKNNALFDSLVEKLMEAAETFRPGVLEKIRFSEKQKRFFLYVRFDKVKAPRPQDIAEKIFRIENPVYLMTREKVIFKRQLTNKKP